MSYKLHFWWRDYEPRLRRMARFGVVGASGTAVNTAMLWLLARLGGLPIALASLLATEVAIINNFLLNDIWTFRANARERPLMQRLFRFNFVALGGMAITVSIVYVATSIAHTGLIAANLLAACVTLLWNYMASSRWIWSKSTALTVDELSNN